MPYKDPDQSKAYKLAHSRLPKQRAIQKARRDTPGYKEYIDPLKRTSMLRLRYGITQGDYQQMLDRQHGGCAVCHTTVTGNRNQYFDVDHDHKTGAVRGLLCRRCNITLGYYETAQELFTQLEAYLGAHHLEYDPKGVKNG
jgi:hypothetical protein